MRKKSFEEILEAAKNVQFSMPSNVKSQKQLLSNGKWGYVFRHDELGELGRILIVPHGNESQICCEVSGEPDDPMTEKRRAILEPISNDIIDKMVSVCGIGNNNVVVPYISPKEKNIVKSRVYTCQFYAYLC